LSIVADSLHVHLGFSPFDLAAPSRHDPRTGRDPACHAVEPACDRVLPPDRAGSAGQHEEDRLGGVLGLMLVAEHLATETKDHRAVSFDHDGEGILVAMQGESVEELPVAQSSDRPAVKECLQLLQDGAR
jgi:hypothetical protein